MIETQGKYSHAKKVLHKIFASSLWLLVIKLFWAKTVLQLESSCFLDFKAFYKFIGRSFFMNLDKSKQALWNYNLLEKDNCFWILTTCCEGIWVHFYFILERKFQTGLRDRVSHKSNRVLKNIIFLIMTLSSNPDVKKCQ